MRLLVKDIRNSNNTNLDVPLTIFEVVKYMRNVETNLLCDYILSIYGTV